MKELAEVFEHLFVDKLKSRFFGALAISYLLFNWQMPYTLLFSSADAAQRIIEAQNTLVPYWCWIAPILIAALYLTIAPWISFGVDWLHRLPTELRKNQQSVAKLADVRRERLLLKEKRAAQQEELELASMEEFERQLVEKLATVIEGRADSFVEKVRERDANLSHSLQGRFSEELLELKDLISDDFGRRLDALEDQSKNRLDAGELANQKADNASSTDEADEKSRNKFFATFGGVLAGVDRVVQAESVDDADVDQILSAARVVRVLARDSGITLDARFKRVLNAAISRVSREEADDRGKTEHMIKIRKSLEAIQSRLNENESLISPPDTDTAPENPATETSDS